MSSPALPQAQEPMMPAADTTIEAARLQRQVFADKTPDERATMAFEMSELVRQLIVDGIHRRHTAISPSDFTLKLIERLHGREFAASGGPHNGS